MGFTLLDIFVYTNHSTGLQAKNAKKILTGTKIQGFRNFGVKALKIS
jgi:hypothetical protein